MKLDYKKTFLIGLAFFSICAFWQMYNNLIPLILRDTFKIGDTVAGVIMAGDNIIGLFLLPVFGAFSDKTNTPIGRRMPYIVGGTAVAAVLTVLLPVIADAYSAKPAVWLTVVFILLLGVLLITMGVYRSPAVALMSDVTPKPLRSSGNAVINVMGTVGAGLYLVLSAIMLSGTKTSGAHVSYLAIFIAIAAVMVASVAALFFTVNEPKLVAKAAEKDSVEAVSEQAQDDTSKKMPKDVRKSVIFMLLTVAFWYMGYNALETAFTKYATLQWNMSVGYANICLLVVLVIATIAFVPMGNLAQRIGRRRSVLYGTAIQAAGFAVMSVYSFFFNFFSPVLFILFAIVGVAYAATVVNTLPMVVEMCDGSEVGKFTGYYYTFSMLAQIATPILSGALLEHVGYVSLFPYSAVFIALAFVMMLFVKHGDSK